MDAVELVAALRRGTVLVAPHAPVRAGWQAWVAVISASGVRDDRPGPRNRSLDLVWLVREWDPGFLAADRCWAEDDGMRTLDRSTSSGEEELRQLVDRHGGPAAFTYPWRTDYPG